MELKVNEVQLPDVIKFNYDELKAGIVAKVEQYKTIVYTDEQIKEAKADRASLNNLKKALNDERIRREREYMKPFNDFKTKINEIISIIDEPVAIIDKQVKEYDAKIKEAKRAEIENLFSEADMPEWLDIKQVFEDNWLNKTTTIKSIAERFEGWRARIKTETATIEQLEEFSFEAMEVYKQTLDLGKAIAEGKRLADIQKRKEAEAQARAELDARLKAQAAEEMHKADEKLADAPLHPEAPVDMAQYMTPPVNDHNEAAQWVGFRALLTTPQALELKKFFEDRNIEFMPL